MIEKKTARNRQNSTRWQPFATRLRLSKLALGVAILAGAKLAVLLVMGLRAPDPSVNHAKTTNTPQAITAVAASQAKTAPSLKVAIFDDAPALAAQQAPAPAQDKKPQQAQPESILSIQQLKTRAEALDRQEQALKTMEADLNTRVAKLQELETMLKGMLSEAKSIKEEKMRHLIDVYTNMKPKQAASVLETLDETIAVKILAGMKGRTAGEILTGVSAKKAAKLSEELTKLQIGPDLPEKP